MNERTQQETQQGLSKFDKICTGCRPSLYIEVEVFAGTDITIACRDACLLAHRIGVPVSFHFNGVAMVARPETDWQRLVAGWYRAGADGIDFAHEVLPQTEKQE